MKKTRLTTTEAIARIKKRSDVIARKQEIGRGLREPPGKVEVLDAAPARRTWKEPSAAEKLKEYELMYGTGPKTRANEAARVERTRARLGMITDMGVALAELKMTDRQREFVKAAFRECAKIAQSRDKTRIL